MTRSHTTPFRAIPDSSHTLRTTTPDARHALAPRSAPASYAAKFAAAFAVLGLRSNGSAITGLEYLPLGEDEQPPSDKLAAKAWRQLERYFADPEFRFQLPLATNGSAFRQRVWDALSEIPVGESRTYGEIARRLGTAARAVGGACGANPIAIIVPCHRVVGSQGSMGGFMGVTTGEPITIKRWLLTHEGYRFGR